MKTSGAVKFDETRGPRGAPRREPEHADQMVRGAVVLPHGTGQGAPRPRLRQGREGEGGRGRRRRYRRRATSSSNKVQEGFMDFDRVIATPGHDGPRRQARSHPRSPRPDAEPQGRHRHVRREDRRGRGEGRQGRVPRREGGHRPRPHRQGLVRRGRALDQRRRADPGAHPPEAVDREGRLPPQHHAVVDHGPRRPHRHGATTPAARPRRRSPWNALKKRRSSGRSRTSSTG